MKFTRKKIFGTLAVLGILAACTSVGERTNVTVGYYSVSGDTFTELDKQISLHGPNVEGVGKALASTDLKMLPNIRYQNGNGKCRVENARVNVQARVTLPKHTNVRKLKADLANAWNNLQEYAKIHEAVHLAIADRYAVRIEKEVMKLPSKKDCKTLRNDVQTVFDRLFKEHHKEQLQFDADEKVRIRQLIAQNQAKT